jgi:hypothetical protein
MKQQRKLTNKTKGMFAGPRGNYGQTLEGRAGDTSGTTYGGQGLGKFWEEMPSVIAGRTEYDPRALQPGNNVSSVQWNSDTLALKAGINDGIASGASVGGTAAYAPSGVF